MPTQPVNHPRAHPRGAVRVRRGAVVTLALAGAAMAFGPGAPGAARDAGGSEPAAAASAPNRTMSGRVSTCVRPRRGRIPALAFDGRELPFAVTADDVPRCRDGTLRILRIQPLTVAGAVTYVRRGGCDRPSRDDRCTARQPTAHVRAADLEDVPVQARRRNGNGAAVAGCTREAITAPGAVGRALGRMRYKRPSDLPGRSVAGSLWSNYGNPGRRFGDADTSYLLWNLPRTARGVLPGGGIVQAVLPAGHPVRLCDAAGLSLPSFDARGRRNGRVRFLYAATDNGGPAIHGWVMRGYAYRDRPFTETLRLR